MVVDKGIFIEHLRAKDKTTTTLVKLLSQGILSISAVSVYELYMGGTSIAKQNDVKKIITNLLVLPFDGEIAIKAGELYNHLKRMNQMIEFRDIFIAATCLTFNQPLATLNKQHFQRIEGLAIF